MHLEAQRDPSWLRQPRWKGPSSLRAPVRDFLDHQRLTEVFEAPQALGGARNTRPCGRGAVDARLTWRSPRLATNTVPWGTLIIPPDCARNVISVRGWYARSVRRQKTLRNDGAVHSALYDDHQAVRAELAWRCPTSYIQTVVEVLRISRKSMRRMKVSYACSADLARRVQEARNVLSKVYGAVGFLIGVAPFRCGACRSPAPARLISYRTRCFQID